MIRWDVVLPGVACLAFTAAAGACNGAAAPLDAPDDPPRPAAAEEVALGDTVTVGLGGTASYVAAGLDVTFLRVVEDSRCPSNVECVWAGDAEVSLALVRSDADRRAVLHTNLEPRSVAVGDVTVELVELRPYPELDTLADPAVYSVRLVAYRAD